ncbi:MAG: hypothetical protein JSS14_22040 [Proteobacteria bacterium]|nr:hypothetical protein [Pseudomonadota bacterium]
MIYPKLNEWVYSPELGREITALKARSGSCYAQGSHRPCMFQDTTQQDRHHGFCDVFSCSPNGSNAFHLIFLDRARWAEMQLLRGVK